jgi:hypothetical protein
MTTAELLDTVMRSGAIPKLEGDSVRCWLPKDTSHLAGALKDRKPELLEILRKAGGRVAQFPRCPTCKSYALYRKNNICSYECLTCGQTGIEEHIARSYDDDCKGPLQ